MNRRPLVVILACSIAVLFYVFSSGGPSFEKVDLQLLSRSMLQHSAEVRSLEERVASLVRQMEAYAKTNDALLLKVRDLGKQTPTPTEPPPQTTTSTPADSESNDEMEDLHFDDEKAFKHELLPLPNPPEGEPNADVLRIVRASLQSYQDRVKNNQAAATVPVYGTACVDDADCMYIIDQMRSLDTPVGHIVIVMSGHNADANVLFASMERLFPGQVTIFRRPKVILGCAESWNTILRAGFSIRPLPAFVMITNADLWVQGGYLAKFAKFNHDNHHKVAANKFMHFSSFSITDYGWKEVGGFDEVIYPAYAEDVEFHIRCVSKGLFVDSYPENNANTHRHVGSRSFSKSGFREKWLRWDKPEYIWRKWGVSMRDYSDYANCRPYKTPWNLPLTHRKSFVVDPQHRHCIQTGNGPRHQGAGGCMLAQCDSCWYDGRVLTKLLGTKEGVEIPQRLYDRGHVHDRRG